MFLNICKVIHLGHLYGIVPNMAMKFSSKYSKGMESLKCDYQSRLRKID